MDIKKGTHKEYRTELFMPIMKEAEGKYIAVLSDDSVDRDEEKLSKGCVEKLGNDSDYLAALLNHDNDILNLVAEWTNKKIVEIDGHTALVAEPKFYKSNPRAQIIKGMLDEGAKPGISIGAVVKNYDEVNGMRVFTELELVEASFVAIPSNRHGRAMAVAKSFNKGGPGSGPKPGHRNAMDILSHSQAYRRARLAGASHEQAAAAAMREMIANEKKYIKEELKVEKEFTQKDIDSAIEKKVEEMKSEMTKQLETKDAEIVKLNADIKKSEEEAQAKVEEAETKVAEAEEALEAEKKLSLEKAKFVKEGGEEVPVDISKELSEGKLPIMRG